MKKIHFIAAFLFSFAVTNLIAQSAAVTWPLTSNPNPNTPTGNLQASAQTIGAGSASPFMILYPQQPYSSSGQSLVTGYQGPGWPAGPVNYTRYMQFDINPTAGNNFTAQFISFKYRDNPQVPTNFNLLKAEVWYAIDNNWNSSVQLSTSPLDYLNTAEQTFSKSINVQVLNGQTFQ